MAVKGGSDIYQKKVKSNYRYREIANDLAARIQIGIYNPGQKLPPVKNLAQGYSVAPLTALQAIKTLEKENRVEVRPRSGTIVLGQKKTRLPATKTIGVVISGNTLVKGWYFYLLKGLNEAIESWGGQLIYYFFNPTYDNWPDVIERIIQENIDILLRPIAFQNRDESEVLKRLTELPMPLITIGDYDVPAMMNNISFNFIGATVEAVEQLIKRGHKNLALFHSGRQKLYANNEISLGFHIALHKYGIKYNSQMEVTDYNSDGEFCMNELVRRDYKPDGLIMTESFIDGAENWFNCHKRQSSQIECVGIVSRPKHFSSLEPKFFVYMILSAEHLGHEAGLFIKKILKNPGLYPLKQKTPFSVYSMSQQNNVELLTTMKDLGLKTSIDDTNHTTIKEFYRNTIAENKTTKNSNKIT